MEISVISYSLPSPFSLFAYGSVAPPGFWRRIGVAPHIHHVLRGEVSMSCMQTNGTTSAERGGGGGFLKKPPKDNV